MQIMKNCFKTIKRTSKIISRTTFKVLFHSCNQGEHKGINTSTKKFNRGMRVAFNKKKVEYVINMSQQLGDLSVENYI